MNEQLDAWLIHCWSGYNSSTHRPPAVTSHRQA